MRLLLDTQALVWTMRDPGRLADRVSRLVRSRSTEVFVSVVSLWEIVTKTSIGKLNLEGDVRLWLTEQGIDELPVTGEHTQALADLPLHHRDPFDRMLVAQARYEGLTLVTADRRLEAYSVAVLPADR